MDIKPIETVYNGYKFRSRLEARWAVFFDAAKIRYEYEPEGYEYNGERYLPDFYLPDFDAHVEVKSNRPGIEKDILRCIKMIHWGGPIKTIIFLGNVPGDSDGGHWHFPALYYSTGNMDGGLVYYGWWYFEDLFNDDGDPVCVAGSVSHARYIQPFYDTNNGGLDGRFNIKKRCFEPLSVEPISDRYLMTEDPIKKSKKYEMSDEEFTQSMKEMVMQRNEIFYLALRKARQARFEHGECG